MNAYPESDSNSVHFKMSGSGYFDWFQKCCVNVSLMHVEVTTSVHWETLVKRMKQVLNQEFYHKVIDHKLSDFTQWQTYY